MTTKFAFSGRKLLQICAHTCAWIAACAMAATAVGAQTPTPRIQSEISSSSMTMLKGSLHPMAQPQYDAGRMPSDHRLNGMSIVFNRSAAQEADLQVLLAAQQNPASPLFHQWLTPDQFAARFGMSQADLDKVQLWLQQQGFSIDSLARSRNLIRFSGTVGQVEMAFQTQMHYYTANGVRHFAPATALSLPVAFAATVANVGNLSDFRPHPMHIPGNKVAARPSFTSNVSGNDYFAPGDIKVVYDFPTTGTGFDGTGQTIAIMGQSSISLSDIAHFQSAAGITAQTPNLILVPGSGSPATSPGDQGESDLDLEWSSTMAPGADIDFVFTGNNSNSGVFDSVQYAVDEKIGNIISISYGACEPQLSTANATALEAIGAQAAAQGQTVIASSGDYGSTACSGITSGIPAGDEFALEVNYPASSQYVTAVGGTEIIPADEVSNGVTGANASTYWQTKSGTDITTSAKTWIPEVAWNDDLPNCGQTNCLSSSGGGASILFTKPAWQTGVPGIPTGNTRFVPDIALYSSPNNPGYLYCTSDQSDWNTTSPPVQTGSCGSGFRASSTDTSLTVAGGTSFAAPIFAGMLAILNQEKGYTTGQGLANTEIYKLAANAGVYSTAFHDVTTGNNKCTGGSTSCGTQTGGFSAGTGYDEVTGLGSIDLTNLAAAWPAGTTTLIGTTTTATAQTLTPTAGTADVVTFTVTSVTGATIPTGTLKLDIDGGSSIAGGTTVTGVALVAGTATYTANFATSGNHQIAAQYSGDTTHAASTGVISFTIGGGSGSGSFTLTANPTTVTVSQGSSGTSAITITPAGGYTGTVNFALATSSSSLQANGCYAVGNSSGDVTVGSVPATTTLTLYTSQSACTAAGAVSKGALHTFVKSGASPIASSHHTSPFHKAIPAGAAALAGLLLFGLRRRPKGLTTLGCLLLLGVLAFASGCGGGGSSGGGGGGGSSTEVAKGTYALTLTGTDTTSTSITKTINLSLVVN